MNHSLAAQIRHGAVVDSFASAFAEIEALVSAVESSQLGGPTPCTDWDVRVLMNHLVYVNLLYPGIANGERLPDKATDHIGDDHVAAFRASGQLARVAFSRPGMLQQKYQSPWGDVPGSVIVQHVVNELLVHGWDLA